MLTKTETIAFTADWQLRRTQYGFAWRGRDFLNAALEVIRDAAKQGVKYLFHGGDMLDLKQQPSELMDQLLEVENELRKHDMYMPVISGNHERDKPTWTEVLGRWLKCYAPDIEPRMQCMDDRTITLPSGLTVYGYPSCSPGELREMIKKRKDPADILVWHGAVKEFFGFGGDDVIAIQDFLGGQFSNVLLGDIHVQKFLGLPGGGVIGYPGSTELCSSSENPEKFYTLLRFQPGQPVQLAHMRIPTRRVILASVGNEETLQQVLSRDIAPFKDEPAIIFLNYNPAIQNVYSRIQMVSHPKSIIRPSPVDVEFDGNIRVEVKESELPPVEHFLPAFISPELTSLHSLAVSLITRKGEDARAEITGYVERRKQELTRTND